MLASPSTLQYWGSAAMDCQECLGMLAGRRKRHVAEGKMVWFSVGNKMKRKEKEIKEKKRKGGRERKTNNEKIGRAHV